VFVQRNLHLFFLTLILGCEASAADCGEVLRVPGHSGTAYVSCQSLSGLSKAEAIRIVESVLRKSPRRGDIPGLSS